MPEFKAGDRVRSDKYGAGIVQGESVKCKDGIRVDFTGGPYDNVYHRVSGRRHPKCGYDTIRMEENDGKELR